MNIAFAASEVFPYSKTGGLADVAGALPKEIARLKHNVKVFTPKYGSIDEKVYGLKYQDSIGEMTIRINDADQKVFVYKGILPESDVEIYFIDCEPYYNRGAIYTNDPDEADRFILFSKAVLEVLQHLSWHPDIIHCNDWQTGLIPLFVKDNYSWDKLFHNTATMFSIHNIGYQGVFDTATLDKADIKQEYFRNFGEIEHNGSVNFMKAALSFADVINTVSETYAKELLTPEYGSGMDYMLQYRSHDLYGILNGIDYSEWNPETDKYLKHKYSANDLTGKQKNKKQLCDHFGLPYDPNIPVIGIISRLAVQKGFDLIARSLEYLSNLECQWVILGSGEDYYEDMFRTFAGYKPEKAACHIGYNNDLAHLIEAGSDMFLMPSHYEPCGLNQIYSLKYGTAPIVRKTGGLADTVKDWDEMKAAGNESGNGFSFQDYNGFALTNAVERAINYFHDKTIWNKIIANGMQLDFSWYKSAVKYSELYAKALSKVKG